MAIQITGSVIANNAVSGALIGKVTCSPAHAGLTTYQLQTNPNRYFALSRKGKLSVAWTGTAVVGNYRIRIHAHGPGWNESANFIIRVVAASPPPPPYPTAITLTPAQSEIPDNAPAGTVVASATVTTSDGTPFTGTLTSGDTTGFFAISGLNIITARALTSADDGTHTTTITAHQGGQSLSAELSI